MNKTLVTLSLSGLFQTKLCLTLFYIFGRADTESECYVSGAWTPRFRFCHVGEFFDRTRTRTSLYWNRFRSLFAHNFDEKHGPSRSRINSIDECGKIYERKGEFGPPFVVQVVVKNSVKLVLALRGLAPLLKTLQKLWRVVKGQNDYSRLVGILYRNDEGT